MKPEQTKLSRPATLIRESYDCVVIGSGYGGGIAASRMSRAGKRVALFEKGEERWPGQFPSTLVECTPELNIHTREGKDIGKRNGLYQLHVGKNQNVFVANGLGGTSLLNANVALRADERTLALDVWPEELRSDPHALDEYYKRAEEMLQPQPYPEDYPTLPKLELLKKQAELMGPNYQKRFYRPPITVTFEDRVNAAGIQQHKSTLTGNDATGINDGSKNTTLVNYISDAWNHGCEIFCEVEARYVLYSEPLKKWVVFYAALAFGRGSFLTDLTHALQFVLCDQVFLAAGTLGTNEILLRSQSMGLPTSPRVGEYFSGNGDILAFAYNTDPVSHAIGMPSTVKPADFKPVGPCITGVIDMRDEAVAPNILDGYVIQEGSVPAALSGVLGAILDLTPGKVVPNMSIAELVGHGARQLATKLGGPYTGALNHTQVYLIMSHDDGQGNLTLGGDNLSVNFADVGREKHIEILNNTLSQATLKVKGSYIPGPFYTPLFDTSLISVHPVGGCIMADSGETGVTNHKGQVYSGRGIEVHDGLYITDGAVIPTPLGVNPFLTISALAERTVALAAQDIGVEIDFSPVLQPIRFKKPLILFPHSGTGVDEDGQMITGGISFSEAMEGYFSTVIKVGPISLDDYQNAVSQAKSSDSKMRFMLSVIAYDVRALVDMSNHQADIMGTVSCRALSAHALTVNRGDFRLFTADPTRTDTKNLVYDLELLSVEGERYLMSGFKVVDNSAKLNPTRLWEQTTTLYVSVTNLQSKELVGLGILTMTVEDFTKELLSFRTYGNKPGRGLWAATEFVAYFAKNLFDHFVPALAPLQYPQGISPPVIYTKGRPMEQSWILSVPDHLPRRGVKEKNIEIQVTRWNGGGKGPILLIPGAAVTYEIFTTQLIDDNFLDYILKYGYDVFALNHRFSPNMPASLEQWAIDDLRIDLAYAVEHVRNITGIKTLSVVSHCVGSVGLTMGLLDGTVSGVGSALFSQVSMHPVGGTVNNIKSTFHAASIWQNLLGQNLFHTQASLSEGVLGKALDQLLRFYPTIPREMCTNASCHRQSFCFGRLYSHGNLDPNIHDNIDKIVGTMNMSSMNQLSNMSHNKKISDFHGKNVYVTEANIKNNFKIPTIFIHGQQNVTFDPVGTKMTYDLVRQINGADLYSRYTFPGMGHLDPWFGKDSARSVFPVVLHHLEEAAEKYKVGYAGL